MATSFEAIRRRAGDSINYTPGVAVDAGDVVVQGELVGVANQDIAANVLGALSIKGVYEMDSITGSYSAGDKVYWDDTNNRTTTTATGNTVCGLTEVDKASGTLTSNVVLNAHSE